MRKLFFGSALLIIILLSSATAAAASGTVTPLSQLSAVDRLSQSIGIDKTQIQAELDAGKTLEKIAEENGMPAAMFKKRIVNANFSPSVTIASAHLKKAVKTKLPAKHTVKKAVKTKSAGKK